MAYFFRGNVTLSLLSKVHSPCKSVKPSLHGKARPGPTVYWRWKNSIHVGWPRDVWTQGWLFNLPKTNMAPEQKDKNKYYPQRKGSFHFSFVNCYSNLCFGERYQHYNSMLKEYIPYIAHITHVGVYIKYRLSFKMPTFWKFWLKIGQPPPKKCTYQKDNLYISIDFGWSKSNLSPVVACHLNLVHSVLWCNPPIKCRMIHSNCHYTCCLMTRSLQWLMRIPI